MPDHLHQLVLGMLLAVGCTHVGLAPGVNSMAGEGAAMTRHASFILYVRDQGAAADFYRRVLAAEPTLDVPGMTFFELADGASLGLMPEAGIKELLAGAVDPGAAAGLPRAEIYLLVEDPGAYHARALAAGARELSPLQALPWGDEAAYSQDPDGHVLAFARRSSP